MARKTYKIEVTQLDIERAIRNNSYKCVVAQAIARTIPEATKILVDLQTIRFTVDDRRLQYLTGEKVAGYVVGFDAGDLIEPFEFGLRRPRVTRRKGVKVGVPMAAYGTHSTKKVYQHPQDETLDLVGADGAVTKEPVLPAKRIAPVSGRGRIRTYGSRMLRINKERFAEEPLVSV